jgi:hypothetical protein
LASSFDIFDLHIWTLLGIVMSLLDLIVFKLRVNCPKRNHGIAHPRTRTHTYTNRFHTRAHARTHTQLGFQRTHTYTKFNRFDTRAGVWNCVFQQIMVIAVQIFPFNVLYSSLSLGNVSFGGVLPTDC